MVYWFTVFITRSKFLLAVITKLARMYNPSFLFHTGSSSKHFLSSPSASFKASSSRKFSQADLQDAVDSFQECFYEIAKIADPTELATALFSASSKKSLPSIDRSHLKIISKIFLEKANCHSGQEYKANVKILTDVWGVLDKTPEYIVAVLSALDKVLPDSAKKLKGMCITLVTNSL